MAALLLPLGTAAALSGARGPVAPRHIEAPPTAHTGGFGEPTCQACHDEYETDLPGGRLALVGLPEAWEPGRAYALTVELRSEEMVRAGFQLAARFARGEAAGRRAGGLAPLDERVAVTGDSISAIPYAHHTRAGTPTPDPSTASWTLVWTAPEEGGEVVFHLAANSANGDDSPLGDLIYTATARAAAPPPR